MNLSEFNYTLPQNLIAQTPVEPRHASRLMVVSRAAGEISHRQFTDLPNYFRRGDILIANNSRVIPARLYGKKESGGKMEMLLLKHLHSQTWEALVGGKRLTTGVRFTLNGSPIEGEITETLNGARRVIHFNRPLSPRLPELGRVPLPPYIHQTLDDAERYQTVYSRPEGSAAAPTAGLHFSPEMLLSLREQRVALDYVTLHIGLDTFKPVEVDDISQHPIHSEWASLSTETAKRINDTKLSGGQLLAVGTTSVRTLETAALRGAGVNGSLKEASRLQPGLCPWKSVAAFEGATDLYIYPGFEFRAVDVMLTNFHLPRSSLLMLVSAFAGPDLIRRAYEQAIAEKYRFYSFGDAMLIL